MINDSNPKRSDLKPGSKIFEFGYGTFPRTTTIDAQTNSAQLHSQLTETCQTKAIFERHPLRQSLIYKRWRSGPIEEHIPLQLLHLLVATSS